MFTFKFAGWFIFWKPLVYFLKGTNVIFLDELFFLIYAAMWLYIDLRGGLDFIFARQFFSQIIYLIQYVKGGPAKRRTFGTPERVSLGGP